jgi:outer membrane protein assembly factor BamB
MLLTCAKTVRRLVSGIVLRLILITGVLGSAVLVTAGAATATTATAAAAGARTPAATSQDWPTFLHDVSRSSATTASSLSTATAGRLTPKWTAQTGGTIEASASVVGTTAYVGSWDGNEYAINTGTGAVSWKTQLGTDTDPKCYPYTVGVSSSAAVVNGVVYVGGGFGNFYALNATTGAILWSVPTGDPSPGSSHYDWSSPLVVNGFAYLGMASLCANPVIQGELLKIDLSTHAIVATYDFVPTGQLGGGVWSTPSYDPATNKIFVTTGSRNNYTQTQAPAIVSVDATTMQSSDAWQLPLSQDNGDADFATAPILTTDAAGDQLVSAADKNGILYTWNRNNLAAGPVWQHQVAVGGQCPQCGNGSISSGTFANGVLYWAGGNNVVSGHGSGGSVTAFDAGTGNVLWTRQTDQLILGAIAYVNGMIAESEGSTFEVLNASSGALLFSYVLPAQAFAAVSVANGHFYVGDSNGQLYAFGTGPAPPTPPADPNCPSGFICQDINNPAAGHEATAGGTLTVSAAGSGITGTADQFRLVSAPVTGDWQSSARLVAESPQAGLTQQAGLIVRQTTAPGSPFYAVLSYPNDSPPDVQVWYRAAFGGNPVQLAKVPVTLPQSIMIQRKGNLFTAGLSAGGTTYQVIPGSTADVDLPAAARAGVAVASGSATALGTASFKSLTVGNPVTTTLAPPPPPDPCPATWTCSDLGNPSPIGDTTGSGASLTLQGAGTGFGGATDSAHYVYQSVSGNTALSAQVVTQPGASGAAEEGLMMRASASPTAPMYSVYVTPGGSATVQWRVNDGVAYTKNLPLPSITSPAYLKITSWRDTKVTPAQTFFSTLTSPDGVTWTPVLGSTVPLSFGSGQGTYLAGLVATAGASGVNTPVVFNAVSLGALATAPPGICPSPWSCTDVGGQLIPAGSQLLQNGTWTVQGSGELYSTYDTFHFIYEKFPLNPAKSPNGDGTVTAHVGSQSGGGPFMRSGVMIRSGTDPGAPYYGAFVTPSNGVAVQWRTTQSAQTTQVIDAGLTAPEWVKIARYTDTVHNVVYYSAYVSSDGVTYTYVPNSEVALTLPGPLIAGLASEADSSTNLATATFDHVAQKPTELPPPFICPSAWSCADIGGALPPGQDSLANGTWTETAGGGDIWGTADSFHFVSQPLAADGTVTTHVTAQQATDPWAKAGPMIRATTDPGSPYYAVFVTPGNGIDVQWRSAQAGTSSQVLAAGTVPVYLRIGRYTTTGTSPQTYYTAYTSPDGSTWTPVPGSTVALNMPGSLLAGFGITSHAQGTAGAVTLDSVAVTPGEFPPPGLACPTGWSCADVGAASPTGSQTLSGGTWTIGGGGSDIFGTADAFHYVWQALAADGSITARVASQTASDPWAKAGLMMRATTDPGSPYYAIFVTPGNGVVVQWRATQGATTAQLSTTGAAPVYLKIVRVGTSFSADTSADGVTWTPVPGSAITLANLSGALLRGFAVTSHNNGTLGTAAFDTVTTAP